MHRNCTQLLWNQETHVVVYKHTVQAHIDARERDHNMVQRETHLNQRENRLPPPYTNAYTQPMLCMHSRRRGNILPHIAFIHSFSFYPATNAMDQRGVVHGLYAGNKQQPTTG